MPRLNMSDAEIKAWCTKQEEYIAKASRLLHEKKEAEKALPGDKKSLLLHIRKELRAWDPIQVMDIEGAEDEYNYYAFDILKLITEGKPRTQLEDHLTYIETKLMGLPGDKEAVKKAASAMYIVMFGSDA